MSKQWTQWTAIATLCALAFLLGYGLTGSAAPIIPEKKRLEDQIRSLAALKRVQLVLDPMPKEIRDAGLESRDLAERWKKRIAASGLEVVEDKDAPMLHLSLSTVTDDKLPGGIAFNPFLSLEQSAHIDGIETRLTVPTYLHIMVGLDTAENLKDTVNTTLEGMLGRCLSAYAAAVKEVKIEGETDAP